MGEIVNLRSRRKAQARLEKEARAEENRRRFGQTRAERQQSESIKAGEARHLDNHRLPGKASEKPGSDEE